MGLNIYPTSSKSGVEASVSDYGELVTAPLNYNSVSYQELASTGTAYNFATPKAGEEIILNGIIVSAGKNVSATTAAEVVLFRATGPDSAVVDKVIVSLELLKNERSSYFGLNLKIQNGFWINATTTDAEIKMSVFYYYARSVLNG